MDLQEYKCSKTENNIKDDSDILSERCWQETHRGDSRKWLLQDGSGKKSNAHVHSTMKDTYRYPLQDETDYIGKRRAFLLQKLYEEAADEIIRERNVPPPVEEYCTEYDINYNATMSRTENKYTNKELYEKYPLYTSPAMSLWNFRLEKNQGTKVFLPGLTASVDLKNPFKRNSGFTKPISEVLDDCHL